MKILNKISVIVFAIVLSCGVTGLAKAATTTVNLGSAGNFAILAGTSITDNPTSAISGNVGLSPAAGSNYAGLTQAEVTGKIYSVNAAGPAGYIQNAALLTTAKNDLTTAFTDAQGRTPVTTVATELGGQTLSAGVYSSESTTFQVTAGAGPLVLDGQGDASSVFIFKMGAEGTGLTVGPGSTVSLINSASACNVFWEVDTASINTTAVFKGNILALNSITVSRGANIVGRLLARNGNVTLDADIVSAGICGAQTATSTPIPTSSSTSTLVTASASSTQTATPKLPNAGIPPGSNTPRNIVLFAIVALTSVSLIVVLGKRKLKI